MAINKKLIHFNEKSVFSEKLANNEILDTSIVFIKDTKEIWTHGVLYNCSSPNLSDFLTEDDLADLNAFMNNSSVSKDGQTLTVKINNNSQSLTNTWRSISDKTDGTSSEISASEKAVASAYNLANTAKAAADNAQIAANNKWTYNEDTIKAVKVNAAGTADSLTVKSKGSATNPIYWDEKGQPVACSYGLNATVPANAKFTDTTSFTIGATASDDDVVVLTGASGTNANSYSASHAKTFGNTTAPYTAKYTSSNATTSISGYGDSKTIKIPQITVDEYGHVRAGADEEVTITMPSAQTIPSLSGGSAAETGKYVSGVTVSGHAVTVTKGTLPTIPTALKNPTSLTFGSKTYDGSSAQTITAADLGLGQAMRYIGKTSTNLSESTTSNTITIDSKSVTAQQGDVVIDKDSQKEYIWNGSNWEEFGNEGNYKTKQAAVSSPSSSGNTTSFIDTISQDENGVITATKKSITNNVTYTGTLVVDQIATFNNTTGQVKASGFTIAKSVPANALFTDTNTHYTSKNIVGTSSSATENGAVSGNGVFLNHLEESTVKSTHKITGGGSVKVTSDSSGNITITGTDTNTDTSTTYDGHYSPSGTAKTGTDSNSTLSFGGAVVTGLNYDGKGHVTGFSTSKLPANPNTNTSHSHSAGVGLVGTGDAGTTGGTYSYKAKLRSETADSADSSASDSSSANRLYPVKLDKSGYLAVNVPWVDTNTDTDTHYTTGLYVGASGSKSNAATTNGNTYLKLYDNSTSRASFKVSGSGTVSVASDANGNITITGSAHPTTLPNANAISFKNTSGTVVSYTGASALDLTGGVYYAATANSANSATSAGKLSTVSKTAWGQTYWTSGGVPTNISGAMTGVTDITMSGAVKMGSGAANIVYDSTEKCIKFTF